MPSLEKAERRDQARETSALGKVFHLQGVKVKGGNGERQPLRTRFYRIKSATAVIPERLPGSSNGHKPRTASGEQKEPLTLEKETLQEYKSDGPFTAPIQDIAN